MKKKKVRRPGFENYERIIMPDVITFGTTIYMRNDKRAIKIVFPVGQTVTFAPQDEIDAEKLFTP
jgi:hypothetical protein